ncbi:MAG: DEAD/DEAH box helicase family protein [Nitrospirae bacterium]|nr:DEAD/DEAH box helicase family protein [Nitrospirota bacterium]
MIIDLIHFKDAHVGKIKQIISDNPSIASALTLGHLPEEFLTLMEAGKVNLLPGNWKEIESDCSCPDWANPCKHLAAVYYLIANEIDKNPFLVFNLRGIPTEDLTSAAGLISDFSYNSWETYLEKYIPGTRVTIHNSTEEKRQYPDIDFTTLDMESLSVLLRDNPLFYKSGDFKRILLLIYKYAADKIDSIPIDEELKLPSELDLFLLHTVKDIFEVFLIPSDSVPTTLEGNQSRQEIPLIDPDTSSVAFTKKKGAIVTTSTIFDFFMRLSINNTEILTPSARFFDFALSLALALIKNALFVPEVFSYNKEEFTIRYVPLVNDEKVKSALRYLGDIMPVNMAFRQKDNAILSKEGAYDILSMYITHLVHYFISDTELSLINDKLINVFVKGEKFRVSGFEESNTAKSIYDWLESFSFRKKDISPSIKIDMGAGDDFIASIDLQNKADSLSPIIPLSELFGGRKEIYLRPIDEVRTEILRQLVIAGEHMPQLKSIVNSKGQTPAVIGMQEMADILGKVKNVFSVLGINLIIPKGLRELARPRLMLQAALKGKSKTVSYLSLADMLEYEWEIAIGNKTLSKKEFLQLVKSAKGVVKYKDEYLLLNPDEVKGILDKLTKPPAEMSSMEVLYSALIGEVGGVLFSPDEAVKRILEELTRPEDISVPVALNAELRPYQVIGMKWLYTNYVRGFGSCLADDMGLGKTITMISVILKLKEDNILKAPALVICPTTLVGNWLKECNKFAPSLNVDIYHGTERKLSLKNKDILVTTYGTLRQDVKKFSDREWSMIVIDEAQNIKNPETTQTKAVKSLKGGSYIAMSGTPVENRLTELWSIVDFTNKGYMGNLEGFKKRYALPIEKYRNLERINQLKKVTAPFILRRLKTDKSIITDLPDKIVFDEYCYLTKDQAALYQQVVDKTMKEIEESEGINRKGLIFKLITSLKQICNHPVNYTKKGKATGGQSGKSEKALEILSKILAASEKALIFTQYTEMGEILSKMTKEEIGEDALFFHGSLQRSKRDKMVDDFQGKDKPKIMIISLKAGGTGLNLTSATNVIHYDLWWNPAVEAQATDRTYRIGQEKNVIVHRLITLGTFEEKIDEMIKAKKELADLTVVTGEQWLTELSNKDLKNIFSLAKDV